MSRRWNWETCRWEKDPWWFTILVIGALLMPHILIVTMVGLFLIIFAHAIV